MIRTILAKMYITLTLLLISVAIVWSKSGVSKIFSGHIYHGTVGEDAKDGDNVDLDSPLYVRNKNGLVGAEICGYTIYKAAENLPFRMVLLEPLTGSAKVVVAGNFRLDYECQKRYVFEIAAHDCNSGNNLSHSDRELIEIEVLDVNDNTPHWSEISYSAAIDEGRMYDQIICLQATDDDQSSAHSRLCRYRISTPGAPFDINNNGCIHNTEPLQHIGGLVYDIKVTAEDCGGLVSDPVKVSIAVNSVCIPNWNGVSDRVEFISGRHQQLLLPHAELDVCDENCNLTHVSVTLKLNTREFEMKCDKDTYSLRSQRKLCGASRETIDLLPSSTLSESEARQLLADNKYNEEIFAFDGKTDSFEIPSDAFNADLGNQFTLSVWMKHFPTDDDDSKPEKDAKEQILCYSDGEVLNRHRYSMFIRNCHLVFLMKKPSAELGKVRPTEWRWKLDEVCDGDWHHYVVSVETLQVSLYVDGKHLVETEHNTEIGKDWPLHLTRRVHTTKLVVGACWQGRYGHMDEYFHGYLAGLAVLVNKTEPDHVVHCLSDCKEKLDFTKLDDLDYGTSVSLNHDMTSVTVSGLSLASVEGVLHRLCYVNGRSSPAAGHRLLTIDTHAVCSNKKRISIEPESVLVSVLSEATFPIDINSTILVSVDISDIRNGVRFLKDIQFIVDGAVLTNEQDYDDNEDDIDDDKDKTRISTNHDLDACLIRTDMSMNLSRESILYPDALAKQLGLRVDLTEDGLVVSAGFGKLSSFLQFLQELQYVNSNWEETKQRSFTIGCTDSTGRFISTQLEISLDVDMHEDQQVRMDAPVGFMGDSRVVQTAVKRLNADKTDYSDGNSVGSKQIGLGMVVIVIVCAAVMITLAVFGVLKLRSYQGQNNETNVEDRLEMEWDNSALTITINPMDQEFDETMDGYTSNVDVEESEAEDESIHENEAECPEEGTKRELEWDDSTLTY